MPHWWPFGKTFTVKCPGGGFAIIHRNVADAFPFEARDRAARFRGQADAATLGSAEIAGEYGSRVSEIFVAIDELNNSQMIDFRSAYTAYMTDPCGKRDFIERVTENIRHERNRLTEIRLKANALLEIVKSAPKNNEVIKAAYDSLGQMLSISNLRQSTRDAIEDARQDARRMSGGGDG